MTITTVCSVSVSTFPANSSPALFKSLPLKWTRILTSLLLLQETFTDTKENAMRCIRKPDLVTDTRYLGNFKNYFILYFCNARFITEYLSLFPLDQIPAIRIKSGRRTLAPSDISIISYFLNSTAPHPGSSPTQGLILKFYKHQGIAS